MQGFPIGESVSTGSLQANTINLTASQAQPTVGSSNVGGAGFDLDFFAPPPPVSNSTLTAPSLGVTALEDVDSDKLERAAHIKRLVAALPDLSFMLLKVPTKPHAVAPSAASASDDFF